MELRAAGLQEQPFRSHGRPLVFVGYAAQEAAFDFLAQTCKSSHGLGLFQGPTLSGKTTIIRHFAESQRTASSIAVIDAAGMNTTVLLEAMLGQFGFEHKFNSVNELINMVKVFILQQTASAKPPMCIIENMHATNPGVLNILCELARIRLRVNFALRMVLVSDRPIQYITKAPAMEGMAKRLTGDFHLAPLTPDEVTDYVYAKMRSGGCFDPENVFPEDVCDELHAASGGWPGVVDRLALLALAKAEYCPVRREHIERPAIPERTLLEEPAITGDAKKTAEERAGVSSPTIYLTHNGKTVKKLYLDSPRLLIGRSEHNDLFIDSSFVSRHHAMLVRHGSATLLMDLNSSNGTFVNSRLIKDQVLIDNDIITIGNYGIKFVDPGAKDREALEGLGFSDTIVMKSLADMRRVLAKENTQLMPVVDDQKEASGDSD